MIQSIIRNFESHDRKVDALTNLLVFLTLCVYLLLLWALSSWNFDAAATLFGLMTTSIAGVLLSITASRHIIYQQIEKENIRRADIIKYTHNLIAVSKDLQGKVHYFGEFIKNGDRPVAAIETLAESISERYESLLKQDAYMYLSGKTVDVIVNLSGSIFGLCRVIDTLCFQLRSTGKSISEFFPKQEADIQVAKISDLTEEIQSVTDQLFELRDSIEGNTEKGITNH